MYIILSGFCSLLDSWETCVQVCYNSNILVQPSFGDWFVEFECFGIVFLEDSCSMLESSKTFLYSLYYLEVQFLLLFICLLCLQPSKVQCLRELRKRPGLFFRVADFQNSASQFNFQDGVIEILYFCVLTSVRMPSLRSKLRGHISKVFKAITNITGSFSIINVKVNDCRC